MTSVSTSGFGSLFRNTASASHGSQAAWVIDPVSGDDNNPGTPSEPLKTMGEFNTRMAGLKLTAVGATMTCTADVLDEPPCFNGTRFVAGASLTCQGTLTDTATATISVVTGLGPSNTMPWQLTTTGVDWTTVPVGSQVRFSTGQLAMIVQVVDANNVIVGAIGAAGTSVVSSAPTVASTATVASMSRMLPPLVNAVGQAVTATPQLIFRNASFDLGHLMSLQGGVQVQIYGCEVKVGGTTNSITSIGQHNFRCVRWTQTGSFAWRCAGDTSSTYGNVAAGTGSTLFNHQQGGVSHSNLTLNGSRLSVNQTKISTGATHIRNAAGPVLVSSGGELVCNGIINGSTGNTGISIDIPLGRLSYFSTSKPTVTAASQPRVGGVTRDLATEIPFIAAVLNAVPPTVTPLTGNGAAFVLE